MGQGRRFPGVPGIGPGVRAHFLRTANAPGLHRAHACMARVDDAGHVELWVNNKAPFNLRSQLSAVWDIPEDRITLQPTSIGGDFGGKGLVHGRAPVLLPGPPFRKARQNGHGLPTGIDGRQPPASGGHHREDGCQKRWDVVGPGSSSGLQQWRLRGVQAQGLPGRRGPSGRGIPEFPM